MGQTKPSVQSPVVYTILGVPSREVLMEALRHSDPNFRVQIPHLDGVRREWITIHAEKISASWKGDKLYFKGRCFRDNGHHLIEWGWIAPDAWEKEIKGEVKF